MRDFLFTAVMTCISRAFLLRDKFLLQLPQADGSGCVVTRHSIPSGGNMLDAVLVQPEGASAAAVLICHGIGETVEHWAAVQQMLAKLSVASLVFDYSGYGRSTGWIRAQQCEMDAVSAFRFLQKQMPSLPISLLGYSLGSGIAAAIAELVKAHGLVLCASYSSIREAARCIVPCRPLGVLFAGLWNTRETLRGCELPLLVVHGGGDKLFPDSMARELAAAIPSCELVVVPALSHNGPIYHPTLAYWGKIAAWVTNAGL